MKTINRLVYVFFLLAAWFVVKADDDLPPPPPPDPGGGLGGVGPGVPASSIDMYVYGLAILAVMFIVFFTRKYKYTRKEE